ncbi:MAG: protein kinase family protein [Blastocatellia bacterium]|nr:protein kinase family protein [Blastocatellia bacterium]
MDLESVRKEVETWQSLSGLPNVISVIEADVFENYVYIVSDFAESGSLEKWLKENEGKANSVEEAVTITRQILHGLEGMHRAGFVHRDLKPANILIKKGLFIWLISAFRGK